MENPQSVQEDEIDLRQYIEVIIKRKNFILIIFLISVIVTAIVSFFTPKVYEVSMIIQPSVMSVTDKGNQYLDSVENIQAKINTGAYSEKIIKEMMINSSFKGRELDFKVLQPKDTNLVRVSLNEKENQKELGVVILNKLLDGLRSDYAEIIEDAKLKIDQQIALINSEISTKNNEIASKEDQLVIQAEKEARLLDEMQEIKSNSDKLMDARKDLFQAKDTKDGISSLLYTTTIQQNITYSNQLQDELINLKVENEKTKAEAKNLSNDINDLRNEIEKENVLKKEIHNVSLLQEPQVSLDPIGPDKNKNVLLAAVLSLFIGIFLVFFMEFWQKGKEGKC